MTQLFGNTPRFQGPSVAKDSKKEDILNRVRELSRYLDKLEKNPDFNTSYTKNKISKFRAGLRKVLSKNLHSPEEAEQLLIDLEGPQGEDLPG